MSVERCIPAAHKAHNSGQGVKGKAAGEATPLDASGFSALLMQLGADETDADVVTGLTDGLASGADEAAPELLASAQQTSDADGTKVDAGLLLTQSAQLQPTNPPVDHSLLLAQSMQFQNSPPVDHSLLLAQSMQFQNSPQPIGQPVALNLTGGALAASVPLETVSQPALPEGLALTPGSAPAPNLAPKGGDGMRTELGEAIKEVAAKVPAPQRSVPRAAVAEVASMQLGSARANANVVAEARTHKVAQGEVRTELNSGLAPALVVSGVGESGVRRAERAGERMASGQGGTGEGAAWGSQALLNADGTEQSFTMSEPTAVMSPEAMVAEQVNYWIGRDVQNAELKLDGMGDSPVEVSISLQGNEARVEFRTDQLEARQVLEGAVSHLKDLLGNEGLVLSGVSVGSSGADGSASQEKKPHQGGRQATVAASNPQAVEARVRPAGLSGRAVDLFV